jgi:hypothetical protein
MLEALSGGGLAFCAMVLAIAYFVRGLTGFGSGLISIPLLTLLLPLPGVVPLIVLLDYTALASQSLSSRKDVRWRELLPLLPFTLAGVLAGLLILKTVSPAAMSHALGVFVLFFALYQYFGLEMAGRYSRGWAALAGSSGGLIGTLFGAGGPFYIIYFRLRGLDKSELRATFAATFLLDGSVRLLGYVASGFFTREFLIAVLAALPVMAVALYVGGHIHTRISLRLFQRAISVLLVVSGVALVLK